jgi:hypothetical protein
MVSEIGCGDSFSRLLKDICWQATDGDRGPDSYRAGSAGSQDGWGAELYCGFRFSTLLNDIFSGCESRLPSWCRFPTSMLPCIQGLRRRGHWEGPARSRLRQKATAPQAAQRTYPTLRYGARRRPHPRSSGRKAMAEVRSLADIRSVAVPGDGMLFESGSGFCAFRDCASRGWEPHLPTGKRRRAGSAGSHYRSAMSLPSLAMCPVPVFAGQEAFVSIDSEPSRSRI